LNYFHPEFARFIIETEPNKPYNGSLESLLKVENDLRQRRTTIEQKLDCGDRIMTLSVFPRLGADPFVEPEKGDRQVREYDTAIPNGKYGFAMQNIEARAGRPSNVTVPVFRDTQTVLPPDLHLKHLVFGPGACGLQATFQCRTLQDARNLHDQLTVMGPFFLALTAASPIYHGVLVDTDTRVNQVAQAVDDRPDSERLRLGKRWSTSPMYLSDRNHILETNGGLPSETKELSRESAEFLQSHGLDPVLARYLATICLRDPLYLEAKDGNPDEVTPEAVHLSLMASFWSHIRLKIPEPNSPQHGWRVEFRPMELQPTEFANAALLLFLNLLKQTFSWLGPEVNLWMPLKLVEENMERAHARNAVIEKRFWFPKNPLQDVNQHPPVARDDSNSIPAVELTINEIVNGKMGFFPGLVPLVKRYLNASIDSNAAERGMVEKYLEYIQERASGRKPTPAAWMRQFVRKHPNYMKDSRVGSDICYDMLCEIASQFE
jgi:glutamate--cysteine ligase catalytic subunit